MTKEAAERQRQKRTRGETEDEEKKDGGGSPRKRRRMVLRDADTEWKERIEMKMDKIMGEMEKMTRAVLVLSTGLMEVKEALEKLEEEDENEEDGEEKE